MRPRTSSPARTAGSPTSSPTRSAAPRPPARSRTAPAPRPRPRCCSTWSKGCRWCRGRGSTGPRPWRRSTRRWTGCARDPRPRDQPRTCLRRPPGAHRPVRRRRRRRGDRRRVARAAQGQAAGGRGRRLGHAGADRHAHPLLRRARRHRPRFAAGLRGERTARPARAVPGARDHHHQVGGRSDGRDPGHPDQARRGHPAGTATAGDRLRHHRPRRPPRRHGLRDLRMVILNGELAVDKSQGLSFGSCRARGPEPNERP
ncbi:exported hypothetical protein [Streptomyces misionensis JCM 4497]